MTWKTWNELDEQRRRELLADQNFWSGLSEEQRQAFLHEADWQELRLVQPAKEQKIASLATLDQVCTTLRLSAVEVYWLMSTRKLPGWLVDGVWKFDLPAVEGWVQSMGGLAAVAKDIQDQMAKHKAGAGKA